MIHVRRMRRYLKGNYKENQLLRVLFRFKDLNLKRGIRHGWISGQGLHRRSNGNL